MNQSTCIPAGFKAVAEGPFAGNFHGPEANQDNAMISSRWNPTANQIEFDVYNSSNGRTGFNQAELEAIPGLIINVLEAIDRA